MRLISFFSAIGERSRLMRVIDWALALASLGYGIYTQSWFWIGFGILAVILAIWSPMAYAARMMPRVVRRKK